MKQKLDFDQIVFKHRKLRRHEIKQLAKETFKEDQKDYQVSQIHIDPNAPMKTVEGVDDLEQIQEKEFKY